MKDKLKDDGIVDIVAYVMIACVLVKMFKFKI